jgi:hypothetical protein
MWRSHLRCTLTVLAFALACSALPWAGAAAPAKRPAPAPASEPTEGERALALFKAKAEQFQRFLGQEPVLLTKEDVSKSATGVLYYHVRIKLLESALDVQRSDSLVSPFMGYLDLIYERETSGSCGDMVIDFPYTGREGLGYTTYEKAMAHASDCFQRMRYAPVQNVRLTFAYQDGRWVFKDAIYRKENAKAAQLLAAMGRAEPPYHRVTDNQAWEALIK